MHGLWALLLPGLNDEPSEAHSTGNVALFNGKIRAGSRGGLWRDSS